jgi:hypothetical protein
MDTILKPGQTVRLCAELAREWYETRAADGVAYAQCAQVGRITDVFADSGYCGLCESRDRECPGPWYVVDFGDGPSSGFGGMYGADELEAA